MSTASFPSRCLLDYDCRLFQANMFTLKDHAEAFDPNAKHKVYDTKVSDSLTIRSSNELLDEMALENIHTRHIACFVHANGGSEERMHHFLACKEGFKRARLRWLVPSWNFYKVFVISLPSRQHNANAFSQTFAMNATIISAVVGRDVNRVDVRHDLIMDAKDINQNTALTFGEVGCVLSHVKVWRRIAETPTIHTNEFVIVFEDDVCLPNYMLTTMIICYVTF